MRLVQIHQECLLGSCILCESSLDVSHGLNPEYQRISFQGLSGTALVGRSVAQAILYLGSSALKYSRRNTITTPYLFATKKMQGSAENAEAIPERTRRKCAEKPESHNMKNYPGKLFLHVLKHVPADNPMLCRWSQVLFLIKGKSAKKAVFYRFLLFSYLTAPFPIRTNGDQ
jgi:hypothetical protein